MRWNIIIIFDFFFNWIFFSILTFAEITKLKKIISLSKSFVKRTAIRLKINPTQFDVQKPHLMKVENHPSIRNIRLFHVPQMGDISFSKFFWKDIFRRKPSASHEINYGTFVLILWFLKYERNWSHKNL